MWFQMSFGTQTPDVGDPEDYKESVNDAFVLCADHSNTHVHKSTMQLSSYNLTVAATGCPTALLSMTLGDV